MPRLTMADLCAGIGGFSLAAEAVGWQPVVAAELNEFARDQYKKNFPEVEVKHDIKEIDRLDVDVICAGFPCQPVSRSGKRRGEADPRWIWPELAGIVRASRPRWAVFENVTGLEDKGLDQVVSDLEKEGYEVHVLSLGAYLVGSPQIRQRLWIVAHPSEVGRRGATIQLRRRRQDSPSPDPAWDVAGAGETTSRYSQIGPNEEFSPVADADLRPAGGDGDAARRRSPRLSRRHFRLFHPPGPGVRNVADGLPRGLAREAVKLKEFQIEALGNSLVPQLACGIFEAINEMEEASHDID